MGAERTFLQWALNSGFYEEIIDLIGDYAKYL